jgi:hypothetical protein
METLGHSQISLTLDTYSHVLPGIGAEAAKRMDEALGEIGCQNGCQQEESALTASPESQDSGEKMVSLNFTSWNQMGAWLRQIDGLRNAA